MFGRFSKMLVVDDSAVQRRIMRSLLNALGYHNIEEAADGRAALSMLSACSYRLVLCDWDMKPMNGVELLKAMRADPRLKRTPFIMATAQMQKKFLDIARDEGITHYLAKPFTAEMLGQRITKLEKMEAA